MSNSKVVQMKIVIFKNKTNLIKFTFCLSKKSKEGIGIQNGHNSPHCAREQIIFIFCHMCGRFKFPLDSYD